MEAYATADGVLQDLLRRLLENADLTAQLAGINGCLELRLNEQHRWHLAIRSGVPKLSRGAAPPPVDGVVRMDLEDFIALARGELRPGPAWVDGRLRVSGDLGFLMRVGQIVATLFG